MTALDDKVRGALAWLERHGSKKGREAMQRYAIAAEGAFGARAEQIAKAFTGRPRSMLLSGIALFHPSGHLGEATTVRSAGGFGVGI